MGQGDNGSLAYSLTIWFQLWQKGNQDFVMILNHVVTEAWQEIRQYIQRLELRRNIIFFEGSTKFIGDFLTNVRSQSVTIEVVLKSQFLIRYITQLFIAANHIAPQGIHNGSNLCLFHFIHESS